MIAQNDVITAWYRHELGQRHDQREDAGLVMGFPLWGGEYVRRFLDYELPSLRTPANSAAFAAHRGELVLYVDHAAFEMTVLLMAHLMPSLAIYVRLIPAAVMQVVHESPGYKYTLMTAVHNLLIHQAAQKGAGFSMGAADIVYSERYFKRLLELGKTHDAIAHLTPIVSQEKAAIDLGDWRNLDGTLIFSASELGSIGWWHACGLMKSWLMNDATLGSMPSTHFIVWRGKDYLRMHCPHLSPVWLSNKLCRAAPLGLGDTIDATGGPMSMGSAPYVPQLSDDMTLITLDNSRDLPAGRVDFAAFRQSLQPYAFCMQQFRTPVMVPTLPTDDGLPDDVIERSMQELLAMLGM